MPLKQILLTKLLINETEKLFLSNSTSLFCQHKQDLKTFNNTYVY